MEPIQKSFSNSSECISRFPELQSIVSRCEKKLLAIEKNFENIKVTFSSQHRTIDDDDLKNLSKKIIQYIDEIDSELEEAKMNEDYDFLNNEIICFQQKILSMKMTANNLFWECGDVYVEYMQTLILTVIRKINGLILRNKQKVLALEGILQKRLGQKSTEDEGVFPGETICLVATNKHFLKKVRRLGKHLQNGSSILQDIVHRPVDMLSKDFMGGDKTELYIIFNSYVLKHKEIEIHYESLIAEYKLNFFPTEGGGPGL